MSEMIEILLGDYIDVLTDYHSGGSYKTLKEKTKILHEPSYAVMVRTLNFENNDFENNLIYCDEESYDFLEYSRLYENDILMNKIANPGSVYIMPKVDYRATCAMNLFLIRLREINQRYMYYVMKNSEEYIKNQAHGTTTKTITKDEVRGLKFYVHKSVEERDQIESLLTLIDAKLANNSKIVIEMEKMIQTVFSYWFVQFEFPNIDGRPYKKTGGKTEWNDDIKAEIPIGWRVENIMETSLCQTIKPGVEMFEEKNYLATANVNGDVIVDGNQVTYENRESRANMEPTIYSVWFAKMKNSVKHISIPDSAEWFVKKYILSTGFLGLQCDEVTFPYIHSFINSEYFELHKDILAHGATQESVNEDDLKNIKTVVPPRDILVRYAESIKDIINRKMQIIKENQELTALKEYILPLFMSGRLTFK